jgi:hypothetical protein
MWNSSPSQDEIQCDNPQIKCITVPHPTNQWWWYCPIIYIISSPNCYVFAVVVIYTCPSCYGIVQLNITWYSDSAIANNYCAAPANDDKFRQVLTSFNKLQQALTRATRQASTSFSKLWLLASFHKLWQASTSFDLTSFDLISFDLTSFDFISFDLTGFDLTSFDLTGFDLTSFDLTSFDLTSFNTLQQASTSFDISIGDVATHDCYYYYHYYYSVCSASYGDRMIWKKQQE